MHRRLLDLAGVPPVYTDGPLLAEPTAAFNELVAMDYLARTTTDPARKAAALARFITVALEPLAGAQDADLEQQVFDSVQSGAVHNADDLDRLSARIDSAYQVVRPGAAAAHRWMRVRLLWEDPLYLSNYMYAGLIALRYYAAWQRAPSAFVPSYLALLRSGWTAPPQVLLRQHLGMALDDPRAVDDAFAMVAYRIGELEQLYRALESHSPRRERFPREAASVRAPTAWCE